MVSVDKASAESPSAHSSAASAPAPMQSTGEYITTIGLEVHSQLLTRSKMFCGCSADIAYAPPNTHVCPVCSGMPGTLPVANGEAVRKTLLTGIALHCTLPQFSKFDRKNYPYPDLMKGYQISQYDLPFCVNGYFDVEISDKRGNKAHTTRIGITRVHLEEDTARLLHRSDADGPYTLMDANRSGLPLIEIVSEPDITSPEEAQQYLMQLRHLLRWIGVSTGNMEEGSFRVDANVSVRPTWQTAFGTKVEVKNMNSFKAVRSALEYEVVRQTGILKSGGRIAQETRGWLDARGVTVSQRSKEQAHDYRYFPEPDLPPLTFSDAERDEIRKSLPELPEARRDRLIEQYGLSRYDATQLTSSRAVADYFESAAMEATEEQARMIAGFIVNDLAKLLSDSGTGIEESLLTAENLRGLVRLITGGAINRNLARQLMPELFESGVDANQLITRRGLGVMRDDAALDRVVDEAIAANPKAVADYLSGKESAIGSFLGPIMKATGGQADAQAARELLKRRLEAQREIAGG